MKAKRRLRIIAPIVALVLVGLVLLISQRPVQLYKVTILPSLGGTVTGPVAVNDLGQVVGAALTSGDRCHLFLWDRENGIQDLGPGFSIDINNTGQIAGTLIDPNGSKHAFIWDPKHGKQLLGTLGGTESGALALNDRGQVVGFLGPDRVRIEAFIWDKTGGMRKLLPNEQQGSNASAINNAGQILGFTGSHLSLPSQVPCFWDSTAAGLAPPLKSPVDYPGGSDLNNGGYVVGTAHNRDKKRTWAFLWRKETGLEGIEYLFPLEHSVGHLRFNDANQILYGEKHTSFLERFSKKYFGPYTQFCLWDPKRGKIVLDRQVPREMGKLLHVEDINNKGCIIGTVRSKDLKHQFGVLLEPIPERWVK
jgi:probable HAF family extracellular repeat protein